MTQQTELAEAVNLARDAAIYIADGVQRAKFRVAMQLHIIDNIGAYGKMCDVRASPKFPRFPSEALNNDCLA